MFEGSGMPAGLCPLCLNYTDVLDSHLIPAGVNRILRDQTISGNPDPLSITAKVTVQSSRQFHDYVFCKGCETRFNRNGERWVLAHMARGTEFRLFDILASSKEIESPYDGDHWYAAAEIPDINTQALAYFGLSMAWRTSVHAWKGIDGFKRRLDLGSYQGPIRKYLLGESSFPTNCNLVVAVWPDKETVLYSTYLPRRHFMDRRFHTYSFYLPGITFVLFLGKQIPHEVKDQCCYTTERKVILSSKDISQHAVSFLESMCRSTNRVARSLQVHRV
jgi:hypothetical protein